MRTLGLMILTLGTMAVPAFAADRTGYQPIVSGDFATAERQLLAERKIYPDRPELMLNLAAVYRKTGREPLARELYQTVLARRAVNMDLPSGDVASSHDLALRALGRYPAQMASR